jgi:acyl dehydratase
MSSRYFEDWTEGEVVETRGATLTESQIVDFAMLYDPQPMHIDKTFAEAGQFEGLIASGFQTVEPSTSIRSSKAPSPPICQSSSLRSSNS